jgi:glycosyltransferase 2 family protein
VKKTIVFLIKLTVMVVTFAFVGIKIAEAWSTIGQHPVHIDWRYSLIIPVGYLGVMLDNSLTWLWLARQMGDRSPVWDLLGAYVFSQMGKYAPGKLLLVLMRIDRTHRVGMSRETCVLSTVLENAMYTLSGGLVGAVAMFIAVRNHPVYLVFSGAMVLGLLVFFYPAVFFGVINLALKSMKRLPIPPSRQFRRRHMFAAVFMFLPCWLCGGIALWGAVNCLAPTSLLSILMFSGAFALSVSLGMFSLLPGGLGIREVIQGIFLAPFLHNSLILVGTAVGLARLFQVVVELILGLIGGVITARHPPILPPPTPTVDTNT